MEIIKTATERATAMSKTYAKEAEEVKNKIKTSMRCFAKAVEEHEEYLLQKLEGMRQTRMKELSDHTKALRGMLESLTRTNDKLVQSMRSDGVELFIAKENGRSEVDNISSLFENMNIKEERIGFIPHDQYLIEQLKRQIVVQPISTRSNLLLDYTLNHKSHQSCRCYICGQLSGTPPSDHNVASTSSMRPQPRFYLSIRPANYYHYGNPQSSILTNVPHDVNREGSGIDTSGNVTDYYNPMFYQIQ
ncbi:unnamed protein product [Diatraea saccharalis]|uniref:Uncharacterized protein n=1 Tax=Diatraea saccharalis TaxID=40085 RepID=A0A9N9RGH1_9NEOP|nr:unnamed protein product [Diatraea saccharalis]